MAIALHQIARKPCIIFPRFRKGNKESQHGQPIGDTQTQLGMQLDVNTSSSLRRWGVTDCHLSFLIDIALEKLRRIIVTDWFGSLIVYHPSNLESQKFSSHCD